MKTRKRLFTRITKLSLLAAAGLLGAGAFSAAAPLYQVPDQGALAQDTCAGARLKLEGVLGERLEANREHWLLCAPQANPGMLEMFRLRDRQPVPNLMPWAGEFVGKYLISAVQAVRLSDSPALRAQVRNVVAELIATQAEDGYLGPFPKAARLKANWDLWGHYHVLQALMLWFEDTGDPASLLACRRAADLICRTFLDTSLRVFDAGSPEMNMAVIHGLGQLHRLTGEPRYLRMMREIEKDWERAGDYLRSGLAGVEYYQSPRPRWESLHDLQGLIELYRITGDKRYRQAFEHHWRSIVRWDRHNNGAFSSGEQATGNPYSPAAIETCCTVAWMALTVDMLRLTGDPLCADELELATFNGGVGAQHPSGRWWTYNTPMDGIREASAHSIVFQARVGTPELNCCSVNAPRILTMLSDWAVTTDSAGLVVNYYGPGSYEGKLRDGTRVGLRWETDYPRAGAVTLRLEPESPVNFRLSMRVPAWSTRTRARLNGTALDNPKPGHYLALSRKWVKGDTVELDFDIALRYVTGDREAAGKVSLYRGPLLLAYDQRYNPFDEPAIPALDLRRLLEAKLVPVEAAAGAAAVLKPWLLAEVPTSSGQLLRLCDFASAGAAGTRYRSWLLAQDCPPPPIATRLPRDGAVVPAGPTLFRWSGPSRTNDQVSEYQLIIARSPELAEPVIKVSGLHSNLLVMDQASMRRLAGRAECYWQVVAVNAHGQSAGVRPLARFVVDSSLPAAAVVLPKLGPDALLVRADLRGSAEPAFGKLADAARFQADAGPDGTSAQAVRLDGISQKLAYAIEQFPEEDYSVAFWVRVHQIPTNRLAQLFSAWCVVMDDPLRVCLDSGKLFARIEAGQTFGTSGVALEPGRWQHIAAVKAQNELRLFINGKPGPAATVPQAICSGSQKVALGGNPAYLGNEFLAASFAGLRFYARALSQAEITVAAQQK